jgi:hypothetical protein
LTGRAKGLFLGQIHADDLVVIARVQPAVGKGGMRPDDRAAGIVIVRLNNVRAADLLVAFGRQPGDDQITLLVEEEEAVLILDNEGIGPARFLAVGGGWRQGFPKRALRWRR